MANPKETPGIDIIRKAGTVLNDLPFEEKISSVNAMTEIPD
jgi:hypothetical protein